MEKQKKNRKSVKSYEKSYYINDIYNITNELINEEKREFRKLKIFMIHVYFFVNLMISIFLIILNISFEYKFDFNKKIAIARVPRTKQKISGVLKEVQFIQDDIKNFDFTIYRVGSRRDRLTFLVESYVNFCLKDLYEIKVILSEKNLLPFASRTLLACVKRIPHTVVYKYAIENIMINYNLTTIYTGQMYDRFALIEGELAKKHKKKLICIPHGIETTEKMPVGYVGDIFYCSSFEMSIKLNDLYATSKFIFDGDITKKMYRVKKSSQDKENSKVKRVVFFTQPRDIESTKKIVRVISRYLETRKQKLYIKIHPSEKSSNYGIENTEIINGFEEAIVGNICISLSSTVLVESLYNDSISISIILLVKGDIQLTGNNEFLNDRRILKPRDDIAILEMIDRFI